MEGGHRRPPHAGPPAPPAPPPMDPPRADNGAEPPLRAPPAIPRGPPRDNPRRAAAQPAHPKYVSVNGELLVQISQHLSIKFFFKEAHFRLSSSKSANRVLE